MLSLSTRVFQIVLVISITMSADRLRDTNTVPQFSTGGKDELTG
jgi:hypothetical protein